MRGVAVQLALDLRGTAAGQDHVVVDEEWDAAPDHVIEPVQVGGLQVVVAQVQVIDDLLRQIARGLDFADAGRRAQVVGDAVGAAEAGESDNFFVVDALVAEAGLVLVGSVALRRNGPELAIEGHALFLQPV